MILSENFANALIPQIWNWFEIGFSTVPRVRDELFSITRSTKDRERYQGIGSIDDAPMDLYKDTGRIGQVTYDPGYETEIMNEEYSVDLIVTRKMIEDSQYTQLRQQTQKLGRMFGQRVEREAASVFNNGVSANHHGADGVPLLSNSHPRGRFNTGVTWDNLGASGLDATKLAAGRIAMRGFTDDVGNPNPSVPNILLVHPDLEDTAIELTQSRFTIDQSKNNAVNPQFGRYRIIAWDYLTDSNAWFLIDSTQAGEHLHWQVRTPLEITQSMPTNVQIKYSLYVRYGKGFSASNWVYGYTS